MRIALLTACVCQLAASSAIGSGSSGRAHQAAQEPRRQPHRYLRRRVHELLPVRLWQLAQDNPVPGDKARWGRFDQLRELNLWTLKDILDEAAKPASAHSASAGKHRRPPCQAQVGDFYASCMDQAAIDAAGLTPIAGDLTRIASTTSKEDLLRVLGGLRRDGVNTLFTMSVGADLKDSTATLMGVDQGGDLASDRDYYVKDDAKNREIREQYGLVQLQVPSDHLHRPACLDRVHLWAEVGDKRCRSRDASVGRTAPAAM